MTSAFDAEAAVSKLVPQSCKDVVDPLAFVRDLDLATALACLEVAEERQSTLAAPIGPQARAPEWRSLERLIGWLRFEIDGDNTRAAEAERVVWLRGGDDLRFLKRLVALDRGREAFDLATSLSEAGRRPTRVQRGLERFIRGDDFLPEDFLDFLDFVHPTMPRHVMHSALMEVPEGLRAHAVARLLALHEGADPERLFMVACLGGVSRVAIEMVARGEVPAHVVEKEAERALEASDPTGAGLWYGLAARAAFYAGDELGVVRCLVRAFEFEEPPLMDRDHIWEDAEPALRKMMERKGLAP